MKRFKVFLVIVLSVSILVACQKELNFEVDQVSIGNLKTDSTDCFPSEINGQYFTDSALSADNYIDVQVNIATTGTYTIFSDTVNGISFRDQGTFGTSGLNTVRLIGSGTPILPGTYSFTIYYGATSCLVDVQVEASGLSATYSFGGAGSTCSGVFLSGNYTPGVAMNDTNTVQVALQIITPGNYSISTTENNGVTFTANGVFNDLLQDSVIVTATGTPLAAGVFVFPLLGNGSSCSFSVTF